MLRAFLCSTAVLALLAGSLAADEKVREKDKQFTQATVAKVDARKKVIILKMRNKEGKEVTRTFDLHKGVRYFDHAGKAADVKAFEAGHEVRVIERDGKLVEVRHAGRVKKVREKEERRERNRERDR